MRYHDYMNQFSVIDETKSTLFSRMKQREKQLQAARVESARSIVFAAATPKKTNTFLLHPKRWAAIAVSAVLVFAAIPTVYFTAFHSRSIDSVKLDYMENLMVEMEGVTAYSIKRETESATPKSLQADGKSKAPAISLLSASVTQDERAVQPFAGKQKSRNYLYSTSERYEAGNVEYDEKSITRVTFKKNKEVTEDVYDNNGKLIDENRIITQDELDAEINKIYTTDEFTYIQFVAPVEISGESYHYKTADGKTGRERVILRSGNTLTYDEHGVADFDKRDYYSSCLSASFVIDNATGYIYQIQDLEIERFVNGLVKASTKDEMRPGQTKSSYYKVNTDENHSLVFTDVMPNRDVSVQNVMLDSCGWVYVLNSHFNMVDRERKIIYKIVGDEYVFDSDKNAYRLSKTTSGPQYSYLSKRIIDGEEVEFEAGGVIRDLRFLETYSNGSEHFCHLAGMFENLSIWAYVMSPTVGNNVGWTIVYDTKNGQNGIFMKYGLGPRWLDSNYDMILTQSDGKLCYTKVDLNECLASERWLQQEDLIPLSEYPLREKGRYYLYVGSDRYEISNVYYYAGMNETRYYRLVRTETGLELQELTSKSYTDTVFIFQPINK